MNDYTQQALKFIVQGEDTLSPVLKRVVKNYGALTDQIEESNKAVYKSVKKSLSAVADLVEQLTDVPDVASQMIRDLNKTLKGMKPIVVPISLKMGGGSSIDNALNALSGSKRAISKLPHFAKGTNYVPQANLPPSLRPNAKDGTLAVLSQGERVIPADAGKLYPKISYAGGSNASKQELNETVAALLNSSKATGKLAGIASLGLDPKGPKLYAQSIKELIATQKEFKKQIDVLDIASKSKLLPFYKKAQDAVDHYNESVKVAGKSEDGLLGEIARNTKFLALSKIVDNVFGKGEQGLSKVGAGRADYQNFIGYVNATNNISDLSRFGGLAGVKRSLIGVAGSNGVSPDAIGAAYYNLMQLGGTNPAQIMALSGLAAQKSMATGEDAATAAESVRRQMSIYGLSASDIQRGIVQQKLLAARTGVNPGQIATGVDAYQQSLGAAFNPALATQNTRAASAFLATFSGGMVPLGQELLKDLAASANGTKPVSEAMRSLGLNRGHALALAQGDARPAIQAIASQLSSIKTHGNADIIAATMGNPLAAGGLQAGLAASGSLVGNYDQNLAATDKTLTDVNAQLVSMVQNTQTVGDKFKTWIATTLGNNGLLDVYNLIHEINPEMLLTASYLASAGVSLLKIPFKAIVSAASAIGGLFSVGAGAAGVAGEAGIAVGLTALGEGLSGLAIGVGALGVAALAWWPTLDKLAPVVDDLIKVGAKGTFEFLTSLVSSKDVGAAAGGVATMGSALTDFGTGLYTVGKGILAMDAALNTNSMGTVKQKAASLGTLVNSVVGAFKVDAGALAKSAAAVTLAANITGALAQTTRDLTDISQFRTQGTVQDAGSYVQTLDRVVGDIAKLSVNMDAIAPNAPHITANFDTSAKLVTSMIPLLRAVGDAGAVAHGFQDSAWDNFFKMTGPFQSLVDYTPRIARYMQTTSDDFATIPDPSAAISGIGMASTLMSNMQPLLTAIGAAAETAHGFQEGAWDNFFNKQGPFQSLVNYTPRIARYIQTTISDFAGLTPDSINGINDTVASAMHSINIYRGLLASITSAGGYNKDAAENVDVLAASLSKVATLSKTLQSTFSGGVDLNKTVSVHVEANETDRELLRVQQEALSVLTEMLSLSASGKAIPVDSSMWKEYGGRTDFISQALQGRPVSGGR